MAQGATTTKRVVILGNPNTGKSTLFNALAGARARVGNFPGVTVERKTAQLRTPQGHLELVDLPGTYSLAPRSLDEMVAVDVLLGRQAGVGPIDLVVCVVDSTNLERNMYLVTQLMELEVPLLLVFNMWDTAQARGLQIDVDQLSARLGVPIVCTTATRRQGMAELLEQIHRTAGSAAAEVPNVFPEAFELGVARLASDLGSAPGTSRHVPRFLLTRLLLDVGGYIERLLVERYAGLTTKTLAAIRSDLASAGFPVPIGEARARYGWIREVLADVQSSPGLGSDQLWSDRIDSILTHRVAGLVVFAGIMFLVFQAIYRLGQYLAGYVETGQELLVGSVNGALAPGMFRSLLVDGAIAGVGGVLVFLPQIALLFFFIALLEDCGYMARAAFLMDRWMGKLGLSGKSFVPLMSSFACAIPGIMATRVIDNPRDRMVTILISPLMSCAARLPVYVLFIGTFIPNLAYFYGWIGLQGLVLFAMYSLGAVVAIPVAWLFRRFVFPGARAPFVLELPSYKWPSPAVVTTRVWDRCLAFVTRAGTLIFAASVLVWAAGIFPGDRGELYRLQAEMEQMEADGDPEPELQESVASQLKLQQAALVHGSVLGRAGRGIEPWVRPLGWDWKLGVAVIASFPAREVVIATLGTIYSLGGDVDEEDPGLQGALRAASWPDGRPIFTVPVALSVMVFFALCAQCGATLMIIRRETNSWRWPVVTFLYMTALAYVAAWITFQVGIRLG